MITILFLGIALLIFLWNLYYQRRWDKYVTVQLHFAESFVYATQQAHLIEQIENKKRLPLPILEVAFRMRKELFFHDMENTAISDYTYKRDIFALLGNQRITRTLVVDSKKRGFYEIDAADYKSYSMLLRSMYKVESVQNANLYVYAKRAKLNGLLMRFDQILGTFQCEKKMIEDPFAFSSIREYSITDPLKTVNWKASAKTGELMVNTFESTLSSRIMFYLDVEDSAIIKQEHLVEEVISVAATLAQKYINKGMEIGLAVHTIEDGMCVLPPKSGKQQLVAIEQTLAKLKNKEDRDTFPILLDNVHTDAIPVFISKNATTTNQKKIEAFLKKEQGMWIIPYDSRHVNTLISTKNLKIIERKVEGY